MPQNTDILLLSVGDIEDDDRREIPLGIAFLSGQLKSRSYSYRIIDLYNKGDIKKGKINTELESFLHNSPPKVIGISSTSYYIEMVHNLVRNIRKILQDARIFESGIINTGINDTGIYIPIIIGGYISIIDNVLKETGADVLCHGEGEETIVELMDFYTKKTNAKQLEGIRGITYRTMGGKIHTTMGKDAIKNLDSLSFPEFDGFNLGEYKYIESIPMYSQRGCYNNCTFCDIIPFYGNRYIRRMSPSRIVEWIEAVHKKYGAKRIDFMDDNFLNSRRHVGELFGQLETKFGNDRDRGNPELNPELNPKLNPGLKNKLNHNMNFNMDPRIRINFQARSNEIIRFSEMLRRYRKFINCVEIGTESFSQSQLNRWKKNVTVLDNINAIEKLSEIGLSYINYYLWLDGETTIEELDENIERLLVLPEVKIVGSEMTVPNFILNYDISAIYDRYGNSSVINITSLYACESFLNKTYFHAKKLSSIYIGLKKMIESLDLNESRYNSESVTIRNLFVKKTKLLGLSDPFFPLAEKLMKRRLYSAVNIAENLGKPGFLRKKKSERMVAEMLREFEVMMGKLLDPIEAALGIDLNEMVRN